MTRLLIALAAGIALSGAQSPSSPPVAGPLITLDAVAIDRAGSPVTDLRPGDFEVKIDGYHVPIDRLTFVGPGDTGGGREIVLVLDDVVLPLALMPRVREAARRFVALMVPGDRMAIVALNGDQMESTDDRSRLLRSIDAYTVRAPRYARLDIAGEHLLTSVTALSRQLAEASLGRKTIVGIGSGWLFDAPIPPPSAGRDLRPEWTAAMRAMSFANVSLYAIDPGGIGASPFGGSSGFARNTGGFLFVNSNDVAAAADRIMREAGSYYLIQVGDPPVGRAASLRELDVRVNRKGVTVRSRAWIAGGRAPEPRPRR